MFKALKLRVDVANCGLYTGNIRMKQSEGNHLQILLKH